MLTHPNPETAQDVSRYGGQGNMLINLIPLDYSFHHTFIEQRDYDHSVIVRLDGEDFIVTLPELLMSFNIFNLRFREQALVDYVGRMSEKCAQDVEKMAESQQLQAQRQNLNAWNQIALELPRIDIIAAEIEEEHPHLFDIWEAAIGHRGRVFLREPTIEQ